MSNITKTAMITVCGRPNVGKSSLTNALVGEKVAIVSNKAQTTRNRIYGIVNREDTQYILLDTPGLHKPKSALGDYMVKVVTSSLSDVDCALLLVEPIPHVGGPEKALIDRIREEKIPCILCINKIDTVEPAELLPVIAAYNEVWDGFDAIIPISAHKGGGLDDLMHELQKYAQEGPQLFPDGETTDQPERQGIGEAPGGKGSRQFSSGKSCCCVWIRRSPTAPPWRSPNSPSGIPGWWTWTPQSIAKRPATRASSSVSRVPC